MEITKPTEMVQMPVAMFERPAEMLPSAIEEYTTDDILRMLEATRSKYAGELVRKFEDIRTKLSEPMAERYQPQYEMNAPYNQLVQLSKFGVCDVLPMTGEIHVQTT